MREEPRETSPPDDASETESAGGVVPGVDTDESDGVEATPETNGESPAPEPGSDGNDDESGSESAGPGASEGPTGEEGEVPGKGADSEDPVDGQTVPEDVRNYARFTKMDGAAYDRVNGFLRDRTYITAREWAMARLCADFRTETGVEMTKIGENLPELVPFMTDTYTPQAVNQARHSFEGKVTKAGSTFLYGAMCDFFTAEELDELMYEVTEVAKFLLEVEGADLSVEAELEAEDRISEVMREVRRSSEQLRNDELAHDHEECPHCGGDLNES